MKYILITLLSFLFLSQTALWANEPIEAEDVIQEEVIQEEVTTQEVVSEEIVTQEPTDEASVAEEVITSEESEPAEQAEKEIDPDAPTADELEAAQAEEAELREVGAGEEPIAE